MVSFNESIHQSPSEDLEAHKLLPLVQTPHYWLNFAYLLEHQPRLEELCRHDQSVAELINCCLSSRTSLKGVRLVRPERSCNPKLPFPHLVRYASETAEMV